MTSQGALTPLALTHLNLDVADLDAAERFYRNALDLPVERTASALRVCTPSYLLVLNAGVPQVGGTFHFGFRVAGREAVDAWIERLRGAGVPVLVEPHHAGAVYVARVTDPDGYEIEVYADVV